LTGVRHPEAARRSSRRTGRGHLGRVWWRLAQLGYAKAALLLFGIGLVLGLVAVVFEVGGLERPAAAAMALGIVAIPLGMLVDWRLATRMPRVAPSRPRSPKPRSAARAKAGAAPAPGTRIARGTSAGEVRWRRKRS
jgi:hypothetical protein